MDFGGTWPERGESENRLFIIQNGVKAHHKSSRSLKCSKMKPKLSIWALKDTIPRVVALKSKRVPQSGPYQQLNIGSDFPFKEHLTTIVQKSAV